jgi:uncharacterized repeat protein (TIGR01451 family)
MVDVVFDATAVPTGTYYADIYFGGMYNDPLVIPVTMTVVAQLYDMSLMDDAALNGMPGEMVTYTLTITNDGNMPDTYDLSASNVWMTDYPASIMLDAGAATTFDVVVTVPLDAMNGDSDDAVVTATSQADGLVMDSVSLTTTAAFDVFAVSLASDGALSAAPGEMVTYTLTITNDGNTLDTYDLSASTIWTTDFPASITLDAGASTTFDVVVTVAADAADGDSDVAVITATSQGDGMVTGSVSLTTTSRYYVLFLPAVFRN